MKMAEKLSSYFVPLLRDEDTENTEIVENNRWKVNKGKKHFSKNIGDVNGFKI